MGVVAQRAHAFASGVVVMAFCGSAIAGGTVDWAKGLVIADGVGVADRHAPSPAAARGTSRRVAEAQARTQIAAMLGALPLAEGGTVANKAKDPDVKERLARAISAAVTIAAEPETDGAWHVTMGVPIEAIRTAIYGRRSLPTDGDSGAPVVVISGVAAKPAVGWTVEGMRVATLWVTDVPPWAKDAPKIRAAKVARGAIDLPQPPLVGGAAPPGGAGVIAVVPRSSRSAPSSAGVPAPAATPFSESTLVVMVRSP